MIARLEVAKREMTCDTFSFHYLLYLVHRKRWCLVSQGTRLHTHNITPIEQEVYISPNSIIVLNFNGTRTFGACILELRNNERVKTP